MPLRNKSKSISYADQKLLWENRWRARSDLLWLCKNILGYTAVEPRVHRPMVDNLLQFPLPSIKVAEQSDKMLDYGRFEYTPWNDPYTLKGSRRNLILACRGTFKTSLNTVAHTIQFLLNYPERTVVLIFSADQKGQDTLKNEIKWHFQYNQRFRELFPDFCPQKRIADWGTAEQIILPNRDALIQKLQKKGYKPPKEPSIMTLSIDKAGTGYHFDLMKCSDIVEATNVVTIGQRDQVKQRFGLLPSLLVHPTGWIDSEGTLYHPDDLYHKMIADWLQRDPSFRQWNIFIQPIVMRNTGEQKPRFDPLEMQLPWKLDKDSKYPPNDFRSRVPLWPERFPMEVLWKLYNDPVEGGLTFASQRLLDMSAVDDDFLKPLSIPLSWVKREAFRSVPVTYNITIVDLANTTGVKANPSCITTIAVDRAGRGYVHDIRHGKFTPDQLIEQLFEVHRKFSPAKIVVEETGFVQGIRPSIKRYEDTHFVYPSWFFHPAPRTTDKATRIVNALGPALRSGDLRFVEPFTGCDHDRISKILEAELRETTPQSTGSSDDIIDTLAYFMLSREWLGKEGLRGGAYDPEAQERLINEALNPHQMPPNVHQEALRKKIFGLEEPVPAYDGMRTLTGW